MKSFKELGLSSGLLKVVEEMKFSEPSEIQEKVIPLALAGKDIIGESATGSGKTLAFGAPIIEKIESGDGLQALVLTPTRELTEQVSKSLAIFSRYKSLRVIPVYGGVAIGPQIRELEYADIVVGTPGRILDHISRRTINLSKVRFLVLDEADRMLDMGFFKDVNEIIRHCPRSRQSFLFSATITSEMTDISKDYMRSPAKVSAESYIDASKLEQVYYEVSSGEKFSLIVHLLKQENSKLVMVFCNTKRNTDFIGNNLKRYGFDALALHGDLNQNQRKRVLEHFHKSEKFILVCTDVAARGLDIKNVSHIYNYDCPKTSTEYIHRIGRTARAGKDGKAITVISERDYENFRRVLSDESLNIKRMGLPEFEKVFINMSGNRYARGGRERFGNRREGGRFSEGRVGRGFGRRREGFGSSRGSYGGRKSGGKRFGERRMGNFRRGQIEIPVWQRRI